MKSIKVIVIGFILCDSACGMARRIYAVYHSGHWLSLAAVLMAWLGVRRRKAHRRNTRMTCGGTQAPR